MPKTICIDIDGTIVHFTEWVDSSHFGGVLEYAPEATHILHDEGWYIIIFSTRADKEATGKFLEENGFYYDSINVNPYQPDNAKGGKPIADVYVDDRAVCFKGDWRETLNEIKNFKPWEVKMAEGNKSGQVAKDILVTDFQQALYLHRHYDEMNLKLTNFAFGQVLVCIGACWTLLYAMQTNSDDTFLRDWVPLGILGVIFLSTMFSLMSLMLISKNRRYFVRICRYINELRDYAIKNNDFGFTNESNMWHDATYPKTLDWGSTQMTCLLLIGLCYVIETIGTGVAFYFAVNLTCKCVLSWIIPIALIILAFIVLMISIREKKSKK